MSRTHFREFHVVPAVIENHVVGKANLRMLEPPLLQVEVSFAFVTRPGDGVLPLRFRHAILRANDGSARVYVEAVPERVVGVIMRIEDEPDWLIGCLPQIREDGARAPRVIGIDHQHVIAEDDPSRVGDDLLFRLGEPHEHTGRDFAHQVTFAGRIAVESHQQKTAKNRHRQQAFHLTSHPSTGIAARRTYRTRGRRSSASACSASRKNSCFSGSV